MMKTMPAMTTPATLSHICGVIIIMPAATRIMLGMSLVLLNQYKNQRSILDTIEYYETGAEAVAFTAAAFIGCELVDSCTAENYN